MSVCEGDYDDFGNYEIKSHTENGTTRGQEQLERRHHITDPNGYSWDHDLFQNDPPPATPVDPHPTSRRTAVGPHQAPGDPGNPQQDPIAAEFHQWMHEHSSLELTIESFTPVILTEKEVMELPHRAVTDNAGQERMYVTLGGRTGVYKRIPDGTGAVLYAPTDEVLRGIGRGENSYVYFLRPDQKPPVTFEEPTTGALASEALLLVDLLPFRELLAGIRALGGVGGATSAARSSAKFADAEAVTEQTVARVAQSEANKGAEYLKGFLSKPEWKAYLKNPAKGARFLGTAVHRATAEALETLFPGRFNYNRMGPDFFDNVTGHFIELTTKAQEAAHKLKGGLYDVAKYATYLLP
jgi:hypothetical protein